MPSAPDFTAAHRVLRETFGLEAFRDVQEPVIRVLLDGRPALAVLPTGSGKSLCYQLPAILLGGLTLVVSPLIALMKDQVEKLQSRGVAAARIDSSLADDEAAEVFAELAAGTLRLLYLSPERLASGAFRQRLRGLPISLVAIDEAHCISEWGHNFRPDYLKLARLCRRLGAPRVLALTATATTRVARDIRKAFRIRMSDHFNSGFHRPNLRLHVTHCGDLDRDQLLLDRLAATSGPAIVYATTRADTERIATRLQQSGHCARAYHAGLAPEVRAAAQDSFMRNETRVIVATIAFGMGIDKPDIRTLIHYHLPKSLEGYAQEIGRAGRDGLAAHCELFANGGDTGKLENFIHGATPSPSAMAALLNRILRLADPGKPFAISTYDLAISLDVREETIGTVLAYLELEDIISRQGSFYDYFRVRPLRSMEDILAGRPPRERARIKTLFAAAGAAYGSLHFRLHEITAATGMSRQQATTTLIELAAAGDIAVVQRGLREVFQMSKSWDARIPPLIAAMTARFEARAAFEFSRIRDVVSYTEARGCRATHLAKYFGIKESAPCGACDLCSGARPARLRPPPALSIPDGDWETMAALRDERHPALASPRQLACFLCGIPRPAATRAKLHLRPEFGLWQRHDFSDILRMLEA